MRYTVIVIPCLLVTSCLTSTFGHNAGMIVASLGENAAMARTISGIVTDQDGESLIGVNVLIKGTTTGTVTDIDGSYSIEVDDENQVLVFSYTGYVSQEISVEGKSAIGVTMMEDVAQLQEVVVVGYGTQRKKDLTGSITSVDAEEYEHQPVNRLDQILQGRTAGVNVTNSSGAPGGTTSIRIRGANSINGNNDPLYVVDEILEMSIPVISRPFKY